MRRLFSLGGKLDCEPGSEPRQTCLRGSSTLSNRTMLYSTANGEFVNRAVGSISVKFWGVLGLAACSTLCLGQGAPTQDGRSIVSAPTNRDNRAFPELDASSQIALQIQDIAGAAFSEGATVTLFTSSLGKKLLTKSDESGQAQFVGVPVGEYLIEISAPGFRSVQEQLFISQARQAQSIVISMVPTSVDAKGKVGSVAVSPKAVKATEKALHSLQVNKLDDAQVYLRRALAIDPNFADGNYLMGILLLRQKEPGRASSYLQKSVELSPNHASALLALGEAEYLQHDYTRAIELLERFLRDQPRSPDARIAQKYVDVMRGSRQPKVDADNAASKLGPAAFRAGVSKTSDSSIETNNIELPSLSETTTETNWAPPDVDDEKIDLDSSAGCRLEDIIRSAGNRVQELVQNVDRYTATEQIDHFNLSPMGLQTSQETRKFDYLVEIRQLAANELDVEEFRDGSVSKQGFPEHIATVGLPSLALVFHPYYQANYVFNCEGHTSWHGSPAWLIHFQPRSDHASAMLVYNVDGHSRAVGLKGRAWIDADNFQIIAMESDITHPFPEIRLLRDHQLIEYGPVSFRHNSMELWLPKSADWYCSLSGRRYHRRHTFSQFLLFDIDDKQKIAKPNESVKSAEPE
jgi:tetratricopeptide (TPR) repeat protein